MFIPLSGIRVVDLSQILAGPYATYQLALLGAEVIKIERPDSGDWSRAGPAPEGLEGQGMGNAFLTQNANKKSLTLDLKTDDGRAAVLRLLRKADVFVENFKPGTAARLGLDSEVVMAAKHDIVHLSISAYGQDGPIGHRPAYDHVVQGMCGIMRTTGRPETEPNKVGAPYIDYATGLNAAFAAMAGLAEVRRTGKGVRLDVAMLDTALMLMSSLVTNHMNTGWQPTAAGNEAWSLSPSSGAFETTAGTLMVAANNEGQFRRLCAAIGRPELPEDPRFGPQDARRENTPDLRRLISEIIGTKSAEHWEEILDAASVPAARVRSLDEVLLEAQTVVREVTRPLATPGATGMTHMPNLGFKADGKAIGPTSPPPRLGAHNNEYLK